MSHYQGEMIEIVLSMLPAVWMTIMITDGLEPKKNSYEDLIEHLKKLGSSLPDEPIPKKLKSKDAHESTSTNILKKEKPD